MQLDNRTVGRNIAKYRVMKDLKALDVARQLGMKEPTYTKYERGETAISIEFVQNVANIFGINPLHLLTNTLGNFIENIHNSAVAIQENSTFQTSNEQQTQLTMKLMENMVAVTERLVTLLEKKNDEAK